MLEYSVLRIVSKDRENIYFLFVEKSYAEHDALK